MLFISHDMWNVRRLCDHILWMDQGRVRAYGPAAEMAERYLSEVNLEALSNERAALQSHRRGTGEIRFTGVRLLDARGRETKSVCSGESLTIEADYHASQPVRQPLFQMSIVDVDTGFTVSTASSAPAQMPVADGPGSIRCIFRGAAAEAAALHRPAGDLRRHEDRRVRRRDRRTPLHRDDGAGRVRRLRRRRRRVRDAAVRVRLCGAAASAVARD